MSSAKIGSSPAPAPARSPAESKPAESKPAVTRPSTPSSEATRPEAPRDEFTRPGGVSRPRVPLVGPAEGTPPTLPRELEPYRKQLDDLALKLGSDPELVADAGKLRNAIVEGIKGIEGFPFEHLNEAISYVDYQVRAGYSEGKERFG
ncbi:MAG TPA: hypothetical protein VNA24_26045 [Hyalangium sp.]|nr:hypothetical protein [Hyalangium sp.]